mmetsp:Transcript_12426/g.23570  ORF Transcript_12426/g.23570 Transcript_12426/m.23570 type:complete len:375 (-) Transcript_12426:1305-2429(-)
MRLPCFALLRRVPVLGNGTGLQGFDSVGYTGTCGQGFSAHVYSAGAAALLLQSRAFKVTAPLREIEATSEEKSQATTNAAEISGVEESSQGAAANPWTTRKASLPRDLTTDEIQAASAGLLGSSRPASVRDGPPPPLPKFRAKPVKPVMNLRKALDWVKEKATAKFDETVEVALNLGVDPKRSDQVVRGMAVLPHGVGKTVRVAVFARGKEAEEALAAGADVVGAEDLVNKIKQGGSGAIDFDRAIGHPSVMPLLSSVARILGPRGLMPNPKLGTLTTDISSAVTMAKAGQVEFRADKTAIVHAPIGKVSFASELLEENAQALINALIAAKPKTLKGLQASTGFVTRMHISSTMGGSVMVSKSDVLERMGYNAK